MNKIEELKTAILRAANEIYQYEMVDTNNEIFEIKEFAEKYKYYGEEKNNIISKCRFATREDWIQSKIKEWLKND